MDELLFNQSSLTKLVQIRRRLEQEFGYGFRLSRKDHLAELLTAAAVNPDIRIKQLFQDFATGLTGQQQQRLRELGIKLPEAAISEA
jgi:hypothetical protein